MNYAYVANDPVHYVDPSGMWSEDIMVRGERLNCGRGCSTYTGGTFDLGTVDPNTITVTANKPKKPQNDEPEGDLGACLWNAGEGFVDGALDPEGAALALGVSAWHAANRTAAEDYRPLTNDERAQPRNRGTLRRSLGSAFRIGAKRIIPGYLAVSAAVGVVNGVVTAVQDPNCRIK